MSSSTACAHDDSSCRLPLPIPEARLAVVRVIDNLPRLTLPLIGYTTSGQRGPDATRILSSAANHCTTHRTYDRKVSAVHGRPCTARPELMVVLVAATSHAVTMASSGL